MKATTFFQTHPVFRYNEFVAYMQETTLANCQMLLNYHAKKGHIKRVRRLLYVSDYPTPDASSLVDSFLVAAKATEDAVIAYHTALELHGLAYTTFNALMFVTKNRSAKSFHYQNLTYRPITLPKALEKHSDVGVKELLRGGIIIRVTNLERTIVDALNRFNLCGGWEEVWRSLERVPMFNVEELIHYTLLFNNATLVAKVGYFLDQLPDYRKIDKRYEEQLLVLKPKQKQYLDYRRKGKASKYISKWNIIVPLELHERQWEEPHV